MKPSGPVTLDDLDDMLATLATWMRAQGPHGIAAMPIFEWLEQEREAMANLDIRLDRALARRPRAAGR
jgi:hypothetical protein